MEFDFAGGLWSVFGFFPVKIENTFLNHMGGEVAVKIKKRRRLDRSHKCVF